MPSLESKMMYAFFSCLVLLQAAKATARRNVRFHVASSNGFDESLLRRKERGKPSPPSSSGKRISLGSAFVLLGVKKPPPKLSKTTTAADKGQGTPPLPPSRLSRSGDEAEGASTSNHPKPRERRNKEGKATKQPQRRDGPAGGSGASQASLRRPRRGGQADNKVLEQAAKIAERRKRCVGRRKRCVGCRKRHVGCSKRCVGCGAIVGRSEVFEPCLWSS